MPKTDKKRSIYYGGGNAEMYDVFIGARSRGRIDLKAEGAGWKVLRNASLGAEKIAPRKAWNWSG